MLQISYHKGQKTTTTSWMRLAITPSLNLPYQKVMDCNIGCEGIFPFDPDTNDAMNYNAFRLFMTTWDDYQYLLN